MVFCNLFTQKDCVTLSFQIVIIYGKVKNITVFIIVPVLRAVGGKYGVLN